MTTTIATPPATAATAATALTATTTSTTATMTTTIATPPATAATAATMTTTPTATTIATPPTTATEPTPTSGTTLAEAEGELAPAATEALVGKVAITSTLYDEDVLEAGHTSVWGSFFDSGSKRWGYSCCLSLRRHRRCVFAAKIENQNWLRMDRSSRSSSGSGSRSGVEQNFGEYEPPPLFVCWHKPPEILRERSEFMEKEHFIAHFLRFLLGQWRQMISKDALNASEPVFRSKEILRQTEDALAPLVQIYEDSRLISIAREEEQNEKERLLRNFKAGSNAVLKHGGQARADQPQEMGMTERFEQMALCAFQRDYAAANQHYVKLTIGSKKWHQPYHGGEGKMNVGFKVHKVQASALQKFDSDETVNNYVRAFRRALLFCQYLRPNDDISKHI
eukprot:TRINITY_DN7990_c0_g2_i1.p1 TRINITY_DN7990_c0_g2~~TRINITY_DN7990_c0_g2_i1.p1  ORF type:complete len:424 (-),score=105.70 TRINITY_DN7990_c0_g2_i1:111-1292(-)